MEKLTREQFIEKIAPLAIVDMKITNVPASLTIAQGILESADGNSELTVKGNNLFGIKGTGTAGSVDLLTTEFVNGVYKKVVATFRKYDNWAESIADHSTLFINGVSWNRSLYHNVIGKDGITAAKEVAKAGYATDPQYAEKLISIIHQNNLLQYDVSVEKGTNEMEQKIAALEEQVRIIAKIVQELSDKLIEVPSPDWFLQEFPNALELINQKTGTDDFWRSFAVALRIIKFNSNNIVVNG